jgi:hypothetical protein
MALVSACLTSAKLWVQSPELQKKKRKLFTVFLLEISLHTCCPRACFDAQNTSLCSVSSFVTLQKVLLTCKQTVLLVLQYYFIFLL